MLFVVKENVVERIRICVIRVSMLEVFKIIMNDMYLMVGWSDIFKFEMIVFLFIFYNIGVSYLLGMLVNKYLIMYIFLIKNCVCLFFLIKSFFCILCMVWVILKEGLY